MSKIPIFFVRINASLMFEEYQNRVITDYKTKKENGLLPQFIGITPAVLKQECLNVYRERGAPDKDNFIIRSFFGVDEKNKGYARIIADCPTPKFRSLSNFFQSGSAKPDRVNTEIIAWLIDFKPRPYAEALDAYEVSQQEIKAEKDNNIEEVDIPRIGQAGVSNDSEFTKLTSGFDEGNGISEEIAKIRTWNNKNIERATISFFAAFLVICGSYIWWKYADKQCMYWTGDHYEIVDCKKNSSDKIILALDKQKVTALKMITKRDTITAASIGNVHYAKVTVDSVDFYTSGGTHPTDSRKRLLPLSDHIFKKYILGKRN
ncbi:hypothetical protein [Pedobacter sp.]|uniref:hypothetical protein n=1 Tax=Pedobacter sp. TaxID=1411316 RepID=UPI003BAAC57D